MATYRIGIDFGGTNIAVGICDADQNYRILAKDSVPTAYPRAMDAIIADMASLCRKVADKAGVRFEDVASVGIASPGTINSANAEVEYYCGMSLYNYPLGDNLAKVLGIGRVCGANDANAAALAEVMAGAAKGHSDAVMITLGTGVGGGIIIDGKIYEGANNAAGELGHTVIVAGGIPCSCGRRGCWEKYASATGLINIAREEMCADPNSKMWALAGGSVAGITGIVPFAAAQDGDEAGKTAVRRYIEYLACGIVNLINTFQPEILVIGGGVSAQKENLLAPLREIVKREQYAKTTTKPTQLVIATLGNDAGIIGAAALGE